MEQQLDLCRSILARLRADRETLAPQPLDTWLAPFVERWQLRHPQASLQSTLAPEAASHPVDAARVSQILTILLDNAARSQQATGHAMRQTPPLRLDITGDGHALRFAVTDHGGGIPRRCARNWAKPRRQHARRPGNRPLPRAKRCAPAWRQPVLAGAPRRRHRGPAAPAAGRRRPAQPDSPRLPTVMTDASAPTDATPFLVIDDDEVFSGTLARALTRRGYAVQVAHHGSAALALAARTPFAYVTLDLHLGPPAEASGTARGGIGPASGGAAARRAAGRAHPRADRLREHRHRRGGGRSRGRTNTWPSRPMSIRS